MADEYTSWSELTEDIGFAGKKGARVISHNGFMYLTGGQNEDESKSNEVWKSLTGKSWVCINKDASSKFPARSVHGLASIGDYLYVFGGAGEIINGQSVSLNDVWRSEDGIEWTQLADFPTNMGYRHEFGWAVLGSTLYVYGGFGNTDGDYTDPDYFNDTWKTTDFVTWTQTCTSNWDNAIREMASCAFDNKMWSLGGSQALKYVYCSADGVTWTKEDDPQWDGRKEAEAFEFDSKLWITSGHGTAGALNDTWYRNSNGDWTEYETDPVFPARSDTAVCFHNNAVFVISGED